MASRIVPLLLALVVIAAGCQSAPKPPPAMQVKTVPIDPAIAALTTAQLIDRLQEEGQFLVQDGPTSGHIEIPAFARGFPLIDAPLPGEEALQRNPTSPVMLELARRGPAALPELLQHLSDTRPTLIYIQGPHLGGPVGFNDSYDARHADPAQQPKGVNQVAPKLARILTPGEKYTVKVGDLCFGAVGMIVNRRLSLRGSVLRETPGTYGGVISTGVLLSPIETPALAEATRADWAKLTAVDHEKSLRADVLRKDAKGFPDPRSAPWGALHSLQRLLFYYPDSGRKLTESMLSKRLVASPSSSGKLAEGETTCSVQLTLVRELGPFEWESMKPKLYQLYESASVLPIYNANARSIRDDLAFECAKRLTGRGHDAAFRKYFGQLIAANESELTNGDEAREPVLRRANARFREFVQSLPPPPAGN